MPNRPALCVATALAAVILVCTLLRGTPQDNQQKPAPAKHVPSDAAKAFRKTVIAVNFPSKGLDLRGWLYKPEGEGPFPAVIWNHGSERYPTDHPELGKFYTGHGFILFLPVRHGHAPSPGVYIQDALNEYAKTAGDRSLVWNKLVALQDEYNADVVAAIDWLKHQPFVDPKQLVVTGCSYGGIQTLLTAEKDLGVKAFVPFAPAAMSWANTALQKRLTETVDRARAPLFLLQAENDYGLGPSEALGPLIRARGGANRAKVYPAFGTTPQEGHGGFACWEEGIAVWGDDVLHFLAEAGVKAPAAKD